jgi:hypothetical protein
MSPEVSSWHLDGDGVWTRHSEDAKGNPLLDLQSHMIATRSARRLSRVIPRSLRS